MAANGSRRAYERYGWIILFASAALGFLGGVALVFPAFIFRLPGSMWLIRAWGLTWVVSNVFALVVIVGPYRRGERWAWYTLWLLPLLLVGYFVIAPERTYSYLLLAFLSALGLILPYRRYFSDAEQRRSRARSTPEDPLPPGHFDE